MPQRPPDITPEIVSGDLTEELLQAYLVSPASTAISASRSAVTAP